MAELKTDYLDDVLDTLQNQLRKYNMIHNDDGTVSFVDVSKYSQNGDNFGAKDINNTNININANTEELAMLKSAVGFTKKQLIAYPFSKTTSEINGITWTDNGDGTLTANGTATSFSDFVVRSITNDSMLISNGKYKVTGCPSGGSTDTYEIIVFADEGISGSNVRDHGDGCEFTVNEPKNYGIRCRVQEGVTVENLIFKPMISYASIEDNTFESYVADLKSLSVKSYVTASQVPEIGVNSYVSTTFNIPNANEILSITPIVASSSNIISTIVSYTNTQISMIFRNNHASVSAKPSVKLLVLYR